MQRWIKSVVIVLLISFAGCSGKSKLEVNAKKYEDIRAHINRGRNYFKQSRFPLAEKEFLEVLKKDQQNPDAFVGLGLVYLSKQMLTKSESYFKKAIEYDPEYLDVYNYLGIIYSEQDKYILAKKMFLKVANGTGYRYSEMAYLNLCQLEIKKENYGTALRYAENGLSYNKKYAPLYFIKGFVYFKNEKYEKAIEFLKKADTMSKRPDFDCLTTLAQAYYKIGDFDNALSTLDIAFGIADTPETIKKITELQSEINKQM